MKLLCPCGDLLSCSGWPTSTRGWLVTSWEIEGIGLDSPNDIMDSRSMWECKECGRIAFAFPNVGDLTVKWYAPEGGNPGGLNDRNELET